MVRPDVRRAHMLTKGYIRGWADERGSVEVIDITRNHGYVSSVNNATVLNFAYEPKVLTHDLELEYAKAENYGLRAINKLRREDFELSEKEVAALIGFLDMHLNRGRYADQSDISTPAVLIKTDWTPEVVALNVADRLLLSQYIEGVVRLASLGLETWEWRVEPWPHYLATGDGAVLLFGAEDGAGLQTVTFPLSPTQLLVIGKPLQYPIAVSFNGLIASKSRRWLVASRGTLRMGHLK